MYTMIPKITIASMQSLASRRGGKCLSAKYVNTHTKLKWRCAKGHEWEAQPSGIKTGFWCPTCGHVKTTSFTRGSLQEYIQIAKKMGGVCLSTTYINANTKLKWRCKKGHEWEAIPFTVKKGHWCPYCVGWHKTIQDMKKVAASRGGCCISDIYIGTFVKLNWKCAKGHIWAAAPDHIIQGTWCPKCAQDKRTDNRRLTIGEMQSIAKERGGECLSEKYIDGRRKLRWQCAEEHIWSAAPNSVKFGRWCPVCANGLGERIARESFEQLFGVRFPRVRPAWLLNKQGFRLELDGYSAALHLAFEHQGQHHFRPIYYTKDRAVFNKRVRDDQIKRELCAQHGVKLIELPEIPTKLPIVDIRTYIEQECKRQHIGYPAKNNHEILDLRKAYTPDSRIYFQELKRLAALRGGRCLSPIYLGSYEKLKWICDKGHVWEAIPTQIKTGHWCHKCMHKVGAEGRDRPTINDIQRISRDRGGICLSTAYVNAKTKLKYRCIKGHEWEAIPPSIQRGGWCPYCAGKNKTIEDMKNMAMAHGGHCMSKTYHGVKTHLLWRCKKGHEWRATPELIARGSWCPYCSGRMGTRH